MKKQVKILMVALVLIGIVVGISFMKEPDNPVGPIVEEEVIMDEAALSAMIDSAFCDKATGWNARDYERALISMNAMAKNGIIEEGQRSAFQTRMEQCSCETLNRLTKAHFSLNAYSGAYIDSLENSLDFMKEIASGDPNLAEASQLMADYRALNNFLGQSFQPRACYTCSYNRYKYRDAWLETRDSWYQKDSYKTYFSKNARIVEEMKGVEEKIRRGHYNFLYALEREIENFHLEEKRNKIDNDQLVRDQIRLSQEVAKYPGGIPALERKMRDFVEKHKRKSRVSEIEEYL